jgi:uncharacterized ferredoxin-like protein
MVDVYSIPDGRLIDENGFTNLIKTQVEFTTGDQIMSIINEEEIRTETLIAIAKKMMIAARTAPKAKGIDNLVITIAEGETIGKIATKMKEMVENGTRPEFYLRDAGNILLSDVILLTGTRISPAGNRHCHGEG